MDTLEEDLKVASKILEWEIGDIWGHVGARLPAGDGIVVKMFRLPEVENAEDWIVQFDYSLNKIGGVGQIPAESTIYTEIFKARPDVNAVAHAHAPMCIALSMAKKQIKTLHMQSRQFAEGVPIFAKPIYIVDEEEGADLARALGKGLAVVIRGHGIVTVGNSVVDACFNAVYLERTAKIQAIANVLGFQSVDDEFLNHLFASRKKLLLRHRGRTEEINMFAPEWKYYKDKVLKGDYWSRGWV